MMRSRRSINSRLNTLLGVEPGEGRAVGLLVALYFVLAASFVFVQTTAFGLFIEEFGARNLPFAYLSIAVLSSSIALFYLRLSERLAFRTLLFANLGFLAAVCVVFWLGLHSRLLHWFIFFLPFWFQTLLNLANLLVWSLAGRMFDVRQAKRLFGLVGAGTWLANMIGGVVIAPILALTGTANLYLLAAFAIGAAGFVLWWIFQGGFVPAAVIPPAAKNAGANSQDKPATSPLKNPYNRLIFAYVLLWWVSFYFIDNIFFDRAGVQFASGADLAAFIGKQLSVIGIIALITSTLLTGRIIRSFGLRAGLFAMPVLVTLSVATLPLAAMLGAPLATLFWIAAAAKTLNLAFGFSLSQAAGTLVYQPIVGHERNRIQTIAEGIVQPAAIGVAGALLLLFNTVLHFDAVRLSAVFLVIAALWLWTIRRLAAYYPTVLSEALVRRSLGESSALVFDPAGIAQLRAGLHSPHAGPALYALNQLEALEPDAWRASMLPELPGLLAHPAPEVRGHVVRRIRAVRLADSVPLVRARLDAEFDADIRALLISCLAGLDGRESASQIDSALLSPEPAMRRAALIGLLENEASLQIERARGILASHAASADEADRLLAAEVLCESPCPGCGPLVEKLLADSSLAIRHTALRAASRQDEPGLIDALIAACASPQTASVAERALIAKGRSVGRAVTVAFLSEAGGSSQPATSLARVLAALGGEEAVEALRLRLDAPNSEIRLQVLRSLGGLGYRLHSRRELFGRLQAEIAEAAWLMAAVRTLEQSAGQHALALIDALQSALADARSRAMLLLSLGLDARALLRAGRALDEAGVHTSVFALETVDALLPAAWKPWVLPLLEAVPAEERLARWRLAGVQPPDLSIGALLSALIDSRASGRFSEWLQLCAMHVAGVQKVAACIPALEPLASPSSDRLSRMACWSLERISSAATVQGEIHMLSLVEKVLVLKSASLFSLTPDNVLADVAERLHELTFEKGEVIFRKGDHGDSMYIIVSGRAQVWDGDRMLSDLRDGGIFGELALLDPAPRSATVKAVEPVHLLQLDEAHFRLVLAERPEVSTAVIRVLTSYLRSVLSSLRESEPGVAEQVSA